jgi:hypothetical protein
VRCDNQQKQSYWKTLECKESHLKMQGSYARTHQLLTNLRDLSLNNGTRELADELDLLTVNPK